MKKDAIGPQISDEQRVHSQLQSKMFWQTGILILNETYSIVNANTSSDAVNNFFTTFINLFNSNGWVAVDTSINTLGNALASYDAIGGGVERSKNRKIGKEEPV